MAVRWAPPAFLDAEKGYRRIMGYKDLWMLNAHLDELGIPSVDGKKVAAQYESTGSHRNLQLRLGQLRVPVHADELGGCPSRRVGDEVLNAPLLRPTAESDPALVHAAILAGPVQEALNRTAPSVLLRYAECAAKSPARVIMLRVMTSVA